MRFSKSIILVTLVGLMACQGREGESTPPPKAMPVKSLTVPADSVILRPEEGLVYYRDKPFTGASVTSFSNGQLAAQIDFLNGKKHGFYRKWFEDGQLSFESQYEAGKQDGMTHTWWKNGNKRSSSAYRMGVPHGKQEQWYASGAKFKVMNLVDGREEGLQQSWRENGKLYNNYEAKNGRIFGLKRANLCYEVDDEIVQYKD